MKKNGFVFMETIVVISVLSVTLMMLFSTYSYILRKARSDVLYDKADNIYMTFYVKQALSGFNYETSSKCKKIAVSDAFTYICDINDLNIYKAAFGLEKIYFVNPAQVNNSAEKENLFKNKDFDATTIDYILANNTNDLLLVAKYKNNCVDEVCEISHASVRWP